MLERSDAMAALQSRTSHATDISARQKRRESADLIAIGIARAIAA